MAVMVAATAQAEVVAPLRLELRNALVPEGKAPWSVALSGDLYNPTSDTVVISGASSPVAGQVVPQVYGYDANGLRQVSVPKTLVLAPRGELEFTPGQRELKFIGLRQDLSAGDEVPLYLKDDKGRVQVFRVTVIGGVAE